jgi:hypothetical protein
MAKYKQSPFIRPVLQQLYHLSEIHVRRVYSSIKLTALSDVSEAVGILNFEKLFNMKIEVN